MGEIAHCASCGNDFDTGKLPNPTGVTKETFDCPDCGAKVSHVFDPFDD